MAATALGACGTVSKDTPDAAIDAPMGPVTVTTLTNSGDGRIDAAATVVFLDGAGNTVHMATVDAQGKISAQLPGPGTVHVLRVTTSGTARTVGIQTFTGVRPGDAITAGLRRTPALRSGAATNMTGTFTPLTGYAYSFINDCGVLPLVGMGNTITPLFYEGCRDGDIELFAIATAVGMPDRYAYTAFPHAANGTFTIPNAWGLFGNFSLSISDVPDDVTSLDATRYMYLSPSSITPVAPRGVAVTGDPPTGTTILTIPYAAPIGARALVVTNLGVTGAVAQHQLGTRSATITAALSQSASSLPLPWLTTRPVPSATGLSWTQTGTGTPDLRLTTWSGRFTTSNGVLTTVTWSLADDGAGAPAITLPGLPADLAQYDPTKHASTPISGEVVFVDRSDLTSYNEARPNAIEYLLPMTSMGFDGDKAFTMRRTQSFGRFAQPL